MEINFIRAIRESLMLSKTELAREANISPITVTRIEQGCPCRNEAKEKIFLVLTNKISYRNEVMASVYTDDGDKRSGLDRRQFSYDRHIPERRSCNDRRRRLNRKLKSK